jgi:hypothetical protein
MSLASLKKHARLPERALPERSEAIDIDTFIEDAVVYANGGTTIDCDNVVAIYSKQSEALIKSPLKRATFTLGEEAIGQLAEVANQAQVSKSKMLRLMIAEYSLRRRGD